MAAIYKVSYVVSGEDHPGAIMNTESRPEKGDQVTLGSKLFTVIEAIDLIPSKGDFHYLHATLQTHNS